jgi:hypothetical protein
MSGVTTPVEAVPIERGPIERGLPPKDVPKALGAIIMGPTVLLPIVAVAMVNDSIAGDRMVRRVTGGSPRVARRIVAIRTARRPSVGRKIGRSDRD